MKARNRWLCRACVALLLSSVGSVALAGEGGSADEGTWKIETSLRAGTMGAHAQSSDATRSAEFDVDSQVSPGIGVEWQWNERWALQGGVRADFYQAEVNHSAADDDSDFRSLTLTCGAVRYFGLWAPWTGWAKARPLVAGAVGYRHIYADLAAPVEDYEPGLGFEIATGLAWERWTLRLGYSRYQHEAGEKAAGTQRAEDLDLPQVFVELGWNLPL